MFTKELRETAVELAYGSGQVGVPWPWNVPDGTWTYESFESLPEDGNRYEVIGGEVDRESTTG